MHVNLLHEVYGRYAGYQKSLKIPTSKMLKLEMLNLKEYSFGASCLLAGGSNCTDESFLVCESPSSVLRTLPSIWWLPVCFVLAGKKSDYVQSAVCESTVVGEREG